MMRGSETVQGIQNLCLQMVWLPFGIFPLLDTISFTLLQGLSLWPRNGAAGGTWCAPEQTEQWKAREMAETGGAFSQHIPVALPALPLCHCCCYLLPSILRIPALLLSPLRSASLN